MAKLTQKQEAFCREYIANGGNATKAALAAGYSKKTARSVGAENLTKPDIKARLIVQREKAQEAFTVTVEQRLNLLWAAANKGLDEYTDQLGNRRPHSLPASVSAVSEINKMLGTGSDDEETAKPLQVIFNVREQVKPE
ncbi:hypothetical protein GCM10023116_43540 [Kistimonas scapharcae]|uniref:Terminase small subunit n=1 Tax=Kistimonas scapharcae TaxID=1036133 RepID=A0ABP8VAL5_9GAMM